MGELAEESWTNWATIGRPARCLADCGGGRGLPVLSERLELGSSRMSASPTRIFWGWRLGTAERSRCLRWGCGVRRSPATPRLSPRSTGSAWIGQTSRTGLRLPGARRPSAGGILSSCSWRLAAWWFWRARPGVGGAQSAWTLSSPWLSGRPRRRRPSCGNRCVAPGLPAGGGFSPLLPRTRWLAPSDAPTRVLAEFDAKELALDEVLLA